MRQELGSHITESFLQDISLKYVLVFLEHVFYVADFVLLHIAIEEFIASEGFEKNP